MIEDALIGLIVAERELGWDHLNELPKDMLDLGDYGLLPRVEQWRRLHLGADLALFHDTSKMIERNRGKWGAVLDLTNPVAIVGQDRRTIEFPLPVRVIAQIRSATDRRCGRGWCMWGNASVGLVPGMSTQQHSSTWASDNVTRPSGIRLFLAVAVTVSTVVIAQRQGRNSIQQPLVMIPPSSRAARLRGSRQCISFAESQRLAADVTARSR